MPIIPISVARLRELFLFEKPYRIQFEHRKASFKQYAPALKEMIENDEVALIERTNKTKTYTLK